MAARRYILKQFWLTTFYVETIMLPRQARDKHRDETHFERTFYHLKGDRIGLLLDLELGTMTVHRNDEVWP